MPIWNLREVQEQAEHMLQTMTWEHDICPQLQYAQPQKEPPHYQQCNNHATYMTHSQYEHNAEPT